MNTHEGMARRWAAALAPALAVVLTGTGAAAGAATRTPGPGGAVMRTVSVSGQQAAIRPGVQ